MNFVEPCLAANLVVLASDGLLMLGLMTLRLRRHGAQAWRVLAWFAALEAAGAAAWISL